MHLRRLHVRRDRVREMSQLADIRRRVDVDALGEIVVRRVGCGEARGQAAVHRRVEELSELREEQLAYVVQRKPRFLHRVRDGHRLEVAAVVHLARLSVDQRVVRR